MADRLTTIGTGGDYADPILWAVGEGNINDGDRAVGEILNDITMSALFRPNQSFPNGGLLKGTSTVTGKTGDGISLGNTAGTRICLSPSDNLDFEDIEFIPGANTYSIQSLGSSTITRVLSAGLDLSPLPNKLPVLNNVVFDTIDFPSSSTSGTLTLNNCLTPDRLIIRNNNLLVFKDSISLASDWLLGRGTYTGSDTLVNFARILQNAPASDFGTGSSDYTVNVDSTSEMVDYANGDYRIKSTSPLATAGSGGGYIGAFLESGSGGVTIPVIINQLKNQGIL